MSSVVVPDFFAANSQKGPFILALGDESEAPPNSLEGYRAALRLGSRIILAVELRVTHDQIWLLTHEQQKERPLTFQEFLDEFHPHQLAIILRSPEAAAVTHFLNAFSLPQDSVVLAMTPYHYTWRELRKQRPDWLLAADATVLTQWNIFSAVFLETLAPQDFDWLAVTEKTQLSPRVQSEIQRRQIPVVLVAEPPFSNLPHFHHLAAIMTRQPKKALEFLNHKE